MDYNTSRNKLLIPEYGRNVQKMVEHAVTIENKEERNELANNIVRIMTQMHKSSGNYGDYTHKIWDHLFIISDFELDVDAPYEMPDREKIESKPEPIEYSDGRIKNRTYGRNLEKIIAKAIEYEDGDEKEALTILIANNLKKAYLLWNSNSIDDAQIIKDLDRLSDGKLVLPEGYEFPSSNDLLGKRNIKDNKKNYQNKGRARSNIKGRKDNKASKYSGSSSNFRKRSY